MTQPGTSGLIFNEPELWEKSREGRCGISIPKSDVPRADLDPALTGDAPKLPQLSELDVVRHFTRLSQWNFCIDSGMYPLGSCTMKYNPKTNEVQAARKGFAAAHPLAGDEFSQGALKLMYELEQLLGQITGFPAVTLQPAAGAHGELTGMLMIHAWHAKQGKQRSKILIPDTAHGTNPASATLCGYRSVNIKSGSKGILEPRTIAEAMDEDTAGIMITNPNTLGLFEENIKEVCDIVHAKGGLVYGDGANMNAVMGIIKPGELGIDVLHLNLHKTFSTPHGGGGPGSGPVAVTRDLTPFLPVPRIEKKNGTYAFITNFPDTIGRMHTFYGHFGVMVRAFAYILSMGSDGLKRASQLAVLNANYIKESLKTTLDLPYDRPCMHECVFTDKSVQEYHISTMDMAKRLLDYGFHPPTVYFPLVVDAAFMVEPTETESKDDLDQFIAAVKAIVKEAASTPELLKSAPHLPKVTRLDEVAAARKPCLKG
ncbi:aminomethyl-transferring glycine dehydrogenase subunit GcvPB [Desulfobacter vibrioformis]|uniref:aminomethyl-transferring glycine dehydrogenase subunit GcvPB n=1 Tax=Desulfobacter vibrioformis TaxID=34031 RepID=UPI0005598EAA|nr:aminomethyl-transferring glycine dehydrogenase subunit GcvPB [Desulfobacter vibrioformis]